MRHPIFSIAKHPTMYLAFPDLTITHTGRLWCCYNQCKHHHDRSVTQIFLQYSDDWGTTWSKPQPLTECLDHDPEERFWNCPRLSTLSDGRIVAVVDQIKGLKGRHSQAREQINLLWFSDDNGDHWQGPLPTPVKGIVPDQLIELRHGPFAHRWLLTAHSTSNCDDGILSQQRLWFSDDAGEHWQGPWIVAQSDKYWFCEGSILELPDGKLVCFLRENSNRGLDAFKCVSCDGGVTWSEPVPFPLPGCHRPVAGLLDDERVFITYRTRQGGNGWSWGAQNLMGALTDIESCLAGKREDAHARIYPIDYDRSRLSDTGYSGWVQLPDKTIYVVNYIVDDHQPLAQIRGYRICREHILLPPPE